MTKLIDAIIVGDLEQVKKIIELGYGDDIFKKDDDDNLTPLHYASCYDSNNDSIEILRLLISTGSKLSQRDDCSLRKDYSSFTSFLSASDRSGYTALCYASSSGNFDMVKLLVESGAYIDVGPCYSGYYGGMYNIVHITPISSAKTEEIKEFLREQFYIQKYGHNCGYLLK